LVIHIISTRGGIHITNTRLYTLSQAPHYLSLFILLPLHSFHPKSGNHPPQHMFRPSRPQTQPSSIRSRLLLSLPSAHKPKSCINRLRVTHSINHNPNLTVPNNQVIVHEVTLLPPAAWAFLHGRHNLLELLGRLFHSLPCKALSAPWHRYTASTTSHPASPSVGGVPSPSSMTAEELSSNQTLLPAGGWVGRKRSRSLTETEIDRQKEKKRRASFPHPWGLGKFRCWRRGRPHWRGARLAQRRMGVGKVSLLEAR
jgi:hypothetical protein